MVYAGLGASTFQYGSSGAIRDRQLRSRVDLYAAHGFGPVQLSFDAPLMAATVLERGHPPCPREDYCETTVGAGEAGLHAFVALPAGPINASAGLGVRADPWNSGTRGRWTNLGQGTVSGVASVVGGATSGPWSLEAWAHYIAVVGREVEGPLDGRLPSDAVSGGLNLGWSGPVSVQLGVTGFSRTGGVEYQDWVGVYSGAEDRWSALAYREIVARGKLSLPLGDTAGLHLGLGRVLVAANGPRDATDISLGLHRYWP